MAAPAQILWGAKDPAFSKRFAGGFKDALPRALEPEFFDGAGHWLQEDAAQLLVPRVAAFARSL